MSEKRFLYFALGVMTVAGVGAVSLSENGIRFPDGTEQTTAAASEVQDFFQASMVVELSPGLGGVFGTQFFTVPDGYRAIVEYASVDCSSPNGNRVISTSVGMVKKTGPTSAEGRKFDVPLGYQGQTTTTSSYVGALSTTLYSDFFPVLSPYVNVLRQSGDGTTSCYFAVNGRHLPVPAGELSLAAAEPAEVQEVELLIPYDGGLLPEEAINPPAGTVVKLLAPE